MLMQKEIVPQMAGAAVPGGKTFTGNRGLDIEEGLIFEIGRPENTGVDLDEPLPFEHSLGSLERPQPAGLPGLSEPEAVRHYVRLSRLNYAIDAGIYPLGSCTMKHNPRLNEAMARLPGFADIHPLQPQSSVQGALELIAELARWLMVMTGMDAVAMSPRAGAHGEACGMMVIEAAIAAKGEGETRKTVLVPESAHGTNPASAAGAGFEVRPLPARADGTLDPAEVKSRLGPEVAAIMLTNPNTCGLFEKDVVEIAALVHEAGAYFYCDGANFNAIMGKTRPGDLGVDAMHINLHKTFSTPHGGGGPGAAPVVLSSRLAPFAPVPFLRREEGGFRLVEHQSEAPGAFGRIAAFHGQIGTFVARFSHYFSHWGGHGQNPHSARHFRRPAASRRPHATTYRQRRARTSPSGHGRPRSGQMRRAPRFDVRRDEIRPPPGAKKAPARKTPAAMTGRPDRRPARRRHAASKRSCAD